MRFLLCAALALFAICAWARNDDSQDIAGSYVALIDLEGLGAPGIEQFLVYLDANGGVLFTSEHESDKESTGFGVWKHLPEATIGMGAMQFRFGPDPGTSLCALVAVTSPPDSCVLKIGGTLLRQPANGSLSGEMFLTLSNLEGNVVVEFPAPLPINMEPMQLEDFPGATP